MSSSFYVHDHDMTSTGAENPYTWTNQPNKQNKEGKSKNNQAENQCQQTVIQKLDNNWPLVATHTLQT